MPAMQVLVVGSIILLMHGSAGYGFEGAQQMSLVSAGQSKGSAVVKIIEMLGDMKAKTKADIEEETASMEEFMQYCSDGSKEKEFSLKTAARSIAENTALVDESKSTITELEDEVQTLSTVISEKESELQEATAIREA